jgi:hypothetical protein
MYESGQTDTKNVFGKGVIPTSYIRQSVSTLSGVKHVTYGNAIYTYIDGEINNGSVYIRLCVSMVPSMGSTSFKRYISYIKSRYPSVTTVQLHSVDTLHALRFYRKLGFVESSEYENTSFIPMRLNISDYY